ncbi:MAG: TPR end-of-group domain-containing protein [Myxococcota bacterium]
MSRLFALLAVLSGCAGVSPAQLRARQYAALARGDVLEGVRLGRARVSLEPTEPGPRYDLACALARAGDGGAALTVLREAVELGFDAPGALTRDADLASLRELPGFAAIVQRAAELARDGVPVAGVRAEVRGGLRVRLPLEGRPRRLALWLHPFGARLNGEIERLAPVLIARGYALAVPVELWAPGWGEAELRRLFEEELPRLSPLVDVDRPLLIGLSAGSHASLASWARAPERFAGVLATGCAPELHGAVLPAADGPIVVINGADDPATVAWRRELPRWQSEGRRVRLEVLPGRGHEFVLDAATLARALDAF